MPFIDYSEQDSVALVTNLVWARMQFPTDSDKTFELFVKHQLLTEGLDVSAGADPRSDAGNVDFLV